MAPVRRTRALWILAGVLWAGTVVTGFSIMWRYAAARGSDSQAPASWPSSTALTRDSSRPTLVMFVHPRCPCSRASLVELGHLVARVRGRVAPTVVFVRPRGADDPDFAKSELRTLATSLPGVALVDDVGGGEARRFGAATSGATLVYDAAGRLTFSGGITAVRGHEGDSFGQERIVALVSGETADRADSPVFGCALEEDSHQPGGNR
jgi:hypothetical protein